MKKSAMLLSVFILFNRNQHKTPMENIKMENMWLNTITDF